MPDYKLREQIARRGDLYLLGIHYGLQDLAEGDYGCVFTGFYGVEDRAMLLEGYRDAADDSDDLDAADEAMCRAEVS